jgi:hypothetical protein
MPANELLAQEIMPLEEEKFEEDDSSEEDSNVASLPPITSGGHKLITHPYDFIIRSLKEQVDDKTLVLADDFQRRQVWDEVMASRFIESLLINVPIPPCYFAESEDASYSVIDGQQRLTAIYRYINNEFPLKSLRVRGDLNRKRFNELGVVDKRTIQSRSIRCVVILKESDPDVKFDVFDRFNSNSVKLNRQELRNSICRGILNDLVKSLSKNETFKKMRQVKDVDKRMRDCEMILRFLALFYDRHKYRSYLSPFLDTFLREGQHLLQDKVDEYSGLFVETIDKVYYVFDVHSFRKYMPNSGSWHSLVNKAIYDVVMLYFAYIEFPWVKKHKEDLIRKFQEVCADVKFQETTFSSTERTPRMQQRLDCWYEKLKELECPVERIVIGSDS